MPGAAGGGRAGFPDVAAPEFPAAAGGADIPGQRRSRRLTDRILMTFHAACDVRELHVAHQLLETLEWLICKSGPHAPGERRRNGDALVAAHERLWMLRHPA